MQNYINNFNSFNESYIYNFNVNDGGIGDCIKFFIFMLNLCMCNNKKLYYKKNNIRIEKYIKLIYDIMYINDEELQKIDNYTIIHLPNLYSIVNYNFNLDIKDVFYFSNEVIENSKLIFPSNIINYISIHVRMGDKFLEIPFDNILCKEDERIFSEEKIYKIIEENMDENIFFCSDNNAFRQKIKQRYNNIIISNGQIGHTTYITTTDKEFLDSITEFYLLTNSKRIYALTSTGFSRIASRFNNIPYIHL
jgi:hypothetical protein